MLGGVEYLYLYFALAAGFAACGGTAAVDHSAGCHIDTGDSEGYRGHGRCDSEMGDGGDDVAEVHKWGA